MHTLRFAEFVARPAVCHFATPRITITQPGDPHDHDFAELFWIEAGAGWHWINDQRRLLEPLTIVFIRPTDHHAFTAVSARQPLRFVNVAFKYKTWHALRDRYRLDDLFEDSAPEPPSRLLREDQQIALSGVASDLRAGRRDALTIDRFLLNLARAVEPLYPSTKEPLPSWLRDALPDADPTSPNPPLTTRDLAHRAHRTPEHVARTIRRCLNCTPTDVLNDAKLARAAARLATTDDAILDIALDCGFGNLSHFYARFATKYRATPRKYRLHQQRIALPGL